MVLRVFSWLVALGASFFPLLAPGTAHAHRVNVFAWVEGQTVHVESKFSGGKRVVSGTVEVYETPSGASLLTGTTDQDGRFSFPLHPETREPGTGLRIVVLAGMGHQNEWLIPADEIGSPAVNPSASLALPESEPLPAIPRKPTGADSEEYRRILEETLDKKLAPLVHRLNDVERGGPGAAEIIGGIGYIVGLLGIGLYLQSRFRRDRK